MPNKNILLLEPEYKNKYPPLGLMKIAQYHGPNGKHDNVRFVKGTDPAVESVAWDRVYITTLFSFEFTKIAATIDYALRLVRGQASRVFVGGIAASLMHQRFLDEPRWGGIRFIAGLLDRSPSESLHLDDFSGDFYADDIGGAAIETLTPDYSILDQIAYQYPVVDAYFTYASRGCIRKCNFCGVPKLEGALRDNESIAGVVNAIERLYGPKKDLILMDNNVVASPRYKDIIAEIRDLGFTRNAKLLRNGRTYVRRVDFNQGVDARILSKDPMYLREMATIAVRPLRIAFDHLGLKKPYEASIRIAHDFGLDELSNYMLYNFHDSPTDLYARMVLNVDLNRELGVRIWSFPMRYQPTDLPNRSYVGEHWSRYELRSMQIILQATHGVVSGEPEFFDRAFGSSMGEFLHLLMLPQHYLFNRDYFDGGAGSAERAAFETLYGRLSADQKAELRSMLSSVDPAGFATLKNATLDRMLRDVLQYYVLPNKSEEQLIWSEARRLRADRATRHITTMTTEEIVEDAGLEEDVA
jgi:hypothetical protein